MEVRRRVDGNECNMKGITLHLHKMIMFFEVGDHKAQINVYLQYFSVHLCSIMLYYVNL